METQMQVKPEDKSDNHQIVPGKFKEN